MKTRPRYYDREIKTNLWMTISIVLIVSTLGTISLYALAALPISNRTVYGSLIHGFSNNAIFYRMYLLTAPVGMAAFGFIINQSLNRLRNGTAILGADKTFVYGRSIVLFLVFGLAMPIVAITLSRTEYYVIGRSDIFYRAGATDVPHHVNWRDIASVEKYCRLTSVRRHAINAQLIFKFRDGEQLETKDEYGLQPLSEANKNYVEIQRIAHDLRIPYLQVNKSSECQDEPKI